jgi:hypothetical protein
MYAVGEKLNAEIWRVVLPLSTGQSVVQMQKHLPGAEAIDVYGLRKILQFASDGPAILPAGYLGCFAKADGKGDGTNTSIVTIENNTS